MAVTVFDQKRLSYNLVDDVHGPGSHIAAEWEHFVAECPSVHLEQLCVWGNVRTIDGWRPVLLTVRYDRLLVAGALILVRPVKRLLNIGYISRGPLVKPPDDTAGRHINLFVANALKNASRRLRLCFLSVDLPYRAGHLPDALRSAGFIDHLPNLPPTGLMNGALLIDLTTPEHDVFMSFRRSLRSNIRQAEKSGVSVRQGNEQDIDLLWTLMNALCQRRGTPPNVSDVAVIRRLWEELRPSHRVRIDVAEIAGKPIVALMTVCLGAWAIPWRIGWAGDAGRLHPEKFLYWSVLRSARARGCTVFDFNWVDIREVAALRDGRDIPASGNSGITFFKMGFGGEIVSLPGTLDFFMNPIVRFVMQRAGRTILSSSLIRKLLVKARV